VAVNPARMVRQRKENNSRVRFLSPEEEVKLRAKIRELCPGREAEFDLALHTGMRQGEQYRLEWADVDLLVGSITVTRTKQGSTRHIPIDSEARAAPRVLRTREGKSGYVSARGRRWFEQVIRAAKIPDLRWHDLRHYADSQIMPSRRASPGWVATVPGSVSA